jgi:hypothetical protein
MSVYGPLQLTTWLDPTVKGTVDEPVHAEVDQGTVTVGPVSPPPPPAARVPGAEAPPAPRWSAPLTYDPRLPDGRVAVGRHAIKITWRVSAKGKTAELAGTIDVEVGGDGTVKTAGPPHGGSLGPDALPMGLRYGGAIDATPVPDGYRLAVRVPAGIEATSFSWRASAGRLEIEAGGATARLEGVPAGGRATVTCIVRGSHDSLGVATFRASDQGL